MVSEYDDRQLEEAIVNCCLQHKLVERGNLKVLISGGVVHIDGEVGSYQQKKAIDRLVAASPGVRRVVNRLRVVPAAPVSDSALAQRVLQTMEAEASLASQAISISSRGGHIELKGTVESATARLDAEYAAWHVPGVAGRQQAPHRCGSHSRRAGAEPPPGGGPPLVPGSGALAHQHRGRQRGSVPFRPCTITRARPRGRGPSPLAPADQRRSEPPGRGRTRLCPRRGSHSLNSLYPALSGPQTIASRP